MKPSRRLISTVTYCAVLGAALLASAGVVWLLLHDDAGLLTTKAQAQIASKAYGWNPRPCVCPTPNQCSDCACTDVACNCLNNQTSCGGVCGTHKTCQQHSCTTYTCNTSSNCCGGERGVVGKCNWCTSLWADCTIVRCSEQGRKCPTTCPGDALLAVNCKACSTADANSTGCSKKQCGTDGCQGTQCSCATAWCSNTSKTIPDDMPCYNSIYGSAKGCGRRCGGFVCGDTVGSCANYCRTEWCPDPGEDMGGFLSGCFCNCADYYGHFEKCTREGYTDWAGHNWGRVTCIWCLRSPSPRGCGPSSGTCPRP